MYILFDNDAHLNLKRPRSSAIALRFHHLNIIIHLQASNIIYTRTHTIQPSKSHKLPYISNSWPQWFGNCVVL